MVISFLHLLSIDFSGFHKLLIPALAVFIHTDSLLCPQPHTNWQQPAIRGRARAADLHFKEAEQRSPAWRHGQHCHCGTQVIILHTAVVSLHTLNMLSLNCSSSGWNDCTGTSLRTLKIKQELGAQASIYLRFSLIHTESTSFWLNFSWIFEHMFWTSSRLLDLCRSWCGSILCIYIKVNIARFI